jgi:2-octaprenylphenol hydroxylase
LKTAYDVVIVGGGVVGAAAALALAQQTSLNVAVIEAKQPEDDAWKTDDDYDLRVSAISHASKHMLDHLGVWQAIQSKRISPYAKMRVWDAEGSGVIAFDAADIDESNLGYIIEDRVIRSSLVERYAQYDNIDYLCPLKIIELIETPEAMMLVCEDGCTIQTALLIAADGADSSLRQMKNIEIKSYDYQHTAIVATVHTSLPHQHTAWQRFLPSGPLAFLPLKDEHVSSIVWSATHDYAKDLMQLDDESFKAELAKQFDHTLGVITKVSLRYAFPLRMRHALHYVQDRFALIGDAAHTIHPLAGQGVNLGLLDAAALTETIARAHAKNRNYATLASLRPYERWRKTDTLAMFAMVEFLKQLFANQYSPVKYIRNMGLKVTNQMPWMKQFLTRYALGKRTDLPSMTHKSE